MNYRMIFNIIGRVMCVEAVFMVPAFLMALYYGEQSSALGFLATIALLFAIGLPISVKKPERRNFYTREGLVSTGLVWLVVSLFGALPFYMSGEIPNMVDSFFESVSGFTTTGVTILPELETLPMSLLYWRVFSQWLGGMGVLVFLLAMAPLTKDKGDSMFLLRAESPGPRVGKLVPRMQSSVKILYLIYIVLTAAQAVLLLLGGSSLFDAVTIALGTAGTGGFGTRVDSLVSFGPYVQTVTTVFMLLFSLNFSLMYFMIMREWKRAFKNEELLSYLGVVIVSTLAIALNIEHLFGSFGEAFRHSAFQVTSIASSSGYFSTDFSLWPEFSRAILLFLMFTGGCAGSTSGGIKFVRFVIIVKSAKRAIHRVLRPNSVKLTHMDGELLEDGTVTAVQEYMILYFLIAIGVSLLLALDGFSLESNVTVVIACLNNLGPGLEAIAQQFSFSDCTVFSKLLLSLTMLLGRLELFPVIALFTPAVWKK